MIKEIDKLKEEALDPNQSVIVESCAGSGKTWLLVSRIIRLLLDDVPPAEILAVTFTRKAAQQMVWNCAANTNSAVIKQSPCMVIISGCPSRMRTLRHTRQMDGFSMATHRE